MATDGNDAAPDGADSPEGVFGNLPSTRPGSRSPRRRGTEADEATPEPAAAEPEAVAAAPVEAEPVAEDRDTAEPEPELPPPGHDPLEPQPGIHGVEDLAWAGVAAAAQVATAGIRFTSRALEAARKSIDRP